MKGEIKINFKNFKEIHIVLENCEAFKIDYSYLKDFSISGITKKIYKYENQLGTSIHCDYAFMKISSVLNSKDCHIDGFPDEWKKPLFERLMGCNDIVAIDLIYEDGSNEYIYVDWFGESDYNNPNQSCKIHEQTGELIIIITADNKQKE